VINRSTTRDTPQFAVAHYGVAILFGTLVAETILASIHVRAHKQAGHNGRKRSDQSTAKHLARGGRPHMKNKERRPTIRAVSRYSGVLYEFDKAIGGESFKKT